MRDSGFREAAGGRFGITPVVELDWNKAPPSMVRGLDAVVSALDADPSLALPTGSLKRHVEPKDEYPKHRSPWLLAGIAAAVVALAAAAVFLRRRAKSA